MEIYCRGETLWRISTRAVWRGNVGLDPTQGPHWSTVSWSVRRGLLSSRSQTGRSTNSLHHVPGKATDTQCQPMKAARRGAIPCKATEVELPKAMGAYLLH